MSRVALGVSLFVIAFVFLFVLFFRSALDRKLDSQVTGTTRNLPSKREVAIQLLKSGNPADETKANGLLEQAAQAGDAIAMRERGISYQRLAMTELGVSYLTGNQLAGEKNPALALSWLNRAAVVGSGEAMYHLAVCHWEGEYLPKNVSEAANIFKDAALHGHGPSMVRWGNCLAYGIGTKTNLPAALELFESAGSAGEPEGWNSLGSCYASGHGVHKDPVKAFEYS